MIGVYDDTTLSADPIDERGPMAQITPSSLRRYQHFILCLWQEGSAAPNAAPVWRYSLENPYTAERRGFGDARDLMALLDQWMALPPHGEPTLTKPNEDTAP